MRTLKQNISVLKNSQRSGNIDRVVCKYIQLNRELNRKGLMVHFTKTNGNQFSYSAGFSLVRKKDNFTRITNKCVLESFNVRVSESGLIRGINSIAAWANIKIKNGEI